MNEKIPEASFEKVLIDESLLDECLSGKIQGIVSEKGQNASYAIKDPKFVFSVVFSYQAKAFPGWGDNKAKADRFYGDIVELIINKLSAAGYQADKEKSLAYIMGQKDQRQPEVLLDEKPLNIVVEPTSAAIIHEEDAKREAEAPEIVRTIGPDGEAIFQSQEKR